MLLFRSRTREQSTQTTEIPLRAGSIQQHWSFGSFGFRLHDKGVMTSAAS